MNSLFFRQTRPVSMLFALAFASLSVGCVGVLEPLEASNATGGNPPGDTGGPIGDTSDAEAFFTSNVAPLLANCSGCHSDPPLPNAPAFMGAPGTDDDYQSIIASTYVTGYDATADLVTIGQLTPAHYGITYTPDQVQVLTDWLALLVSAPVGDTGDPEAFFTSKVAPILSAPVDCRGCHSGAAPIGGNAFMGTDASTDFQTLKASSVVANYDANALLVTYGQLNPAHFGRTYSAAEVQVLTDWLALIAP